MFMQEHVVAGAREMMRYRRNRASTLEGATQQAAPSSGSNNIPSGNYQSGVNPNSKGNWNGPTDLSAGGNTPWAVYQNNGGTAKPAASSGANPAQQPSAGMIGAQSSSVRKVKRFSILKFLSFFEIMTLFLFHRVRICQPIQELLETHKVVVGRPRLQVIAQKVQT